MKLTLLDEVSSTNEVVKSALREGKAEGLVVRARRQMGGYGRQGRGWASPEGGLYMSVLLRPDVAGSGLATLSLLVGLAVQRALAQAIAPQYADGIQVKWPNDVVFVPAAIHGTSQVLTLDSRGTVSPARYQKLCGISLEACGGGVCVGIGINVFPPAEPVEVGGGNTPAYVANFLEASDGSGRTVAEEVACLPGRERLARQEEVIADVQREVLARLFVGYGRWRELGFALEKAVYEAVSYLDGRSVRIEDAAGAAIVEGVAEGIDDRGRLLVRTARGVVPVASGEAHVVPLV